MPLYEYECSRCGERFERIEKFTAPHTQKCPKCAGKAERLLAPPAFQFKGSGWYVTDYARKGSGAAAKADDAPGSKETKEKKAEPPEKKPAAKKPPAEKN